MSMTADWAEASATRETVASVAASIVPLRGPRRCTRRPPIRPVTPETAKSVAAAKPKSASPTSSSARIWTASAPTRKAGRTPLTETVSARNVARADVLRGRSLIET